MTGVAKIGLYIRSFFVCLFVSVLLLLFVNETVGALCFFVGWPGFCWYVYTRPDVGPHGAVNDVHENADLLRSYTQPFEQVLKHPVTVGKVFDGRNFVHYSIDPEVVRKNHISILGASGTGKSKIAALILTQMHESGDGVVVIDPKDDEFLPGIIARAAEKTGRPFLFINLRAEEPQINPLAGASQTEREILLQSALQLDPTGEPGVDFYRGEDRDAASALLASGGKSLPELREAGVALKDVTKRENFWREFKSLCLLPAFQTKDARDLKGVIEAGGVVYIVGDTDDLRVVAGQKMLLTRVLQIIKSRPREGAKQVSLMLDEFKYLLSNSSLRALGTIRDRRCNLILAYQSYGDLADCGPLPKEAVLGAAKQNTTLKFVYKLEDTDTALDFSRMAGTVREMELSRSTIEVDGIVNATLREGHKDAVSVDMLTTNMPKPIGNQPSVCWVFGQGPAFLLATMHLPAGKYPTLIPASDKHLPKLERTVEDLI